MEIKGIDKLRKKLSNISQLVPREAAVVLTDAVLEMQGFSQGKMQADAGGGIEYEVAGKTKRRSAPGQFPQVDTGVLIGSLFFRAASTTNLTASFGTNIDYGYFLEFGTSRMAARPWLRPSYKAVVGEALFKKMAKRVNIGIKKAVK
jgi:phage gpG-like protein